MIPAKRYPELRGLLPLGCQGPLTRFLRSRGKAMSLGDMAARGEVWLRLALGRKTGPAVAAALRDLGHACEAAPPPPAKRGQGRPRMGAARSVRVTASVTPSEAMGIEAAAKRAGMSVPVWLRAALVVAAASTEARQADPRPLNFRDPAQWADGPTRAFVDASRRAARRAECPECEGSGVGPECPECNREVECPACVLRGDL